MFGYEIKDYFKLKLKSLILSVWYFILVFNIFSCEPLVDTFTNNESFVYHSRTSKPIPSKKDTIIVMTWNIRFGAGRILWFGDSCGDRVILSRSEVFRNLDLIVSKINEIKPDILLLQEVDIQAKRTDYIDELQYILDNTYFNFGVYTSNWKAQYIPSDGLGRMDEGNAILSVWPLGACERFQLPLRNDLDALTKYFYVRECVMTAEILIPDTKPIIAVNTHLSAFSTDDTKKRQLDEYYNILTSIQNNNQLFVTGGDFNLLPPNSDSTDYCDEDKCPNESFHGVNDNPKHKDGSYYTPEITWMSKLFADFYPTYKLADYKLNQRAYFTHTTNPASFWDRTLDYLFSNSEWVENSHHVYQSFREVSDHAPVTAKWRVK